MIGLIINNKAITQKATYISNEELQDNVYWLAETPSESQIGKVASWGVLGSVFELSNSMTIKQAREKIEELETVLPMSWCKAGTTINKQLFSLLSMTDKLVSPFPEYVESGSIDEVRIRKAKAKGAKKVYPTRNVRLRDLTLPEKLSNTKIIAHPRCGHEGLYEITIKNPPAEFEELKVTGKWVTCTQLEALEKIGFSIDITNAIKFISQEEFIPATKHPLLKGIMDTLPSTDKKSMEKLERIIINFLCNIPRSQGMHPATLLIKGQLWSVNVMEVASLINNGISVSSFSHNSVWVNVHE